MVGDRYIAGSDVTCVPGKRRFSCNAWGQHIEGKLYLNTVGQSFAHHFCLRTYSVFNSLVCRIDPDR